jgi:homoserine kinase type II
MKKLNNLKKEDFNSILDNYNIGKHKSHKYILWALGNTVFTLKTTKGKYVLKIFGKNYPEFIKYQIKIMHFLKKRNIPVQEVIKTKTKKDIFKFKNKCVVIYKYVEGSTVKKPNNHLLKDIAKKQSLMNKALLKLKNKHTWGRDWQFKAIKPKTTKFGKFDLRKYEKSLLKEIKQINRKNLRKGIIHGDFHTANLLKNNNKLKAILDWDDVHKDYLAYEIAVFIAHTLLNKKRLNKKRLKLYLKEYQKNLRLNKDEQKAIYFFIKHRYIVATSWCASKIKDNKSQKEKVKEGINKMMSQYLTFNKMPLEKFLELFK